jgi:hypothetical protein
MNDPTGLRAKKGGFWSGLWNASEAFSIGMAESVACSATLYTFAGCTDGFKSNINNNGVVKGLNLSVNPLIPAVNSGVACTTGSTFFRVHKYLRNTPADKLPSKFLSG